MDGLGKTSGPTERQYGKTIHRSHGDIVLFVTNVLKNKLTNLLKYIK